MLWHIEQGLMPRETGKRWEWAIARAHGDPFLVALQDYDWADEVLHAQIGRRWLQDAYPSRAEPRRPPTSRWSAGSRASTARRGVDGPRLVAGVRSWLARERARLPG